MDDLLRHREDSSRAASDPLNRRTDQGAHDPTIRLVSPDPSSPVVRVEPLSIRKNKIMPVNSLRGGPPDSSRSQHERGGYDPRLYAKQGLDTIEEDPVSPKKKSAGSLGRKWSWLGKRGTYSADDRPPTPPRKNSPEKTFDGLAVMGQSVSAGSSEMNTGKAVDLDSAEGREMVEKKRRWFQKMFSKSKQKENIPLVLQDHDVVDDISEETESNGTSGEPSKGKGVVKKSYPPATSVDAADAAAANAPIEISQNWFAKFFHIKPATRVMCLSVNKMRARKDLVKILRNWHKYGLRDVVSERRASGDVVRGRVDACNCKWCANLPRAFMTDRLADLHIKPVNFHAYLYCVLEHGRKANLSIMKFTQEKGAASSFYRVVETLEKVFNDKGMLVNDTERRKGIERSLKEAGL